MSGVGEIAYWLICVGVVVCMGALIYAAWWALFSDRPRGQRRCPRCWYNMAHAPPPGMTCAECGYVARKESQFHRTHRRYGIATIAILLNVAIAIFITERSMQRGFPALLPSRVLIWVLPITSVPNGDLYKELDYRAARAMLTDSQWISFIERCASGDWRARPIDEEWKKKYGACITSFRQLFTEKPHILEALLSIPPEVEITSRQVWPVGVPVTASLQVRDWWPVGTECRVRITPRVNGVEPITAYRSAMDRWPRSPFVIHLPPLDSQTTELEIEVHVERRLPANAGQRTSEAPNHDDDSETPWQPVFDRTIRIPMKAEGTIEQVAKPVSNKAMNDAMAEVFNEGVIKWEDGGSPVRFNVFAPHTFAPAFANTAVGIRVELLRSGVVARRLNMWWLGGQMGGVQDLAARSYGFEVDYEDQSVLQQLIGGDKLARWELRIIGDQNLALRAGKADQYWAGEISIPVRASTRRGEAPPHPWRRAE